AGHSVGDLLVVVGAALAAAVADLADRGHMDDVVQLPVPAPGQPVDRPVAGGDLDRGGAVVGGEPVAVREAADVAHVAEHRASHDRPDAVDVGDRGSGGGHRLRGAAPGLTALGIDALQVGNEV